MEELERKINKF